MSQTPTMRTSEKKKRKKKEGGGEGQERIRKCSFEKQNLQDYKNMRATYEEKNNKMEIPVQA